MTAEGAAGWRRRPRARPYSNQPHRAITRTRPSLSASCFPAVAPQGWSQSRRTRWRRSWAETQQANAAAPVANAETTVPVPDEPALEEMKSLDGAVASAAVVEEKSPAVRENRRPDRGGRDRGGRDRDRGGRDRDRGARDQGKDGGNRETERPDANALSFPPFQISSRKARKSLFRFPKSRSARKARALPRTSPCRAASWSTCRRWITPAFRAKSPPMKSVTA